LPLDFSNFPQICVVGFFAIGLHEYAHCKVADLAGDPTPRIYGRVTLNLTKHFEPLGTVMMLVTAATGYGIGWGRPAPCDPSKMRNPRWDSFAVAAAGPLSNIIQAIVWALIARLLMISGQIRIEQILPFLGGPEPTFLGTLLFLGVFLNLSLAFFNLLPIPPLDGHWLLGHLLPQPAQDKWFYYSRRYGWGLLLCIVVFSEVFPKYSIFRVIGPLIERGGYYLFGVHLR
jgi:Zn-dependent protease